ncbi:hypothetical protein ABZW32_39015 [Streptomyces sp. NPDC004667]|uniref:hypothetical protein n=1 Tax=Streptomyces sp. NPDC004667 TaxID=3154285 RepID=UPI0033A155D8
MEDFSALRGILVDVVGVGADRTEVTARAAELGVRFVEFFLEPTPAVLTAFVLVPWSRRPGPIGSTGRIPRPRLNPPGRPERARPHLPHRRNPARTFPA